MNSRHQCFNYSTNRYYETISNSNFPMKASDIFHKTSRGLSEIGTRISTLSVKQRRVLILVNGENDAATLKELPLCDNIAGILDTLLRLSLIERVGGGAAYDYAP